MKTIILSEPGDLNLTETYFPSAPRKDEAQVRVCRVGICGTDLHAFRGTQPYFSYPRILGHELALEVVEIGPGTAEPNLRIGDLCCLRPYLNCGHCSACLRGRENCCEQMQVLGVHLDGGMREVMNVPVDKLHKSPLLKEEELALVEMLSIGCHAVRRAQVIPGETALVVGMGPIGLGVSLFAHLSGAHVMATDISAARLAFASRQKGVEYCFNANEDVLEQMRLILPDKLPTLVFDATGNIQSMRKSFEYVAHGGRLVFPGFAQGDITFSDPEFHRRELSVLASRNANAEDFREVISMLEARSVDLTQWITHLVTPEQLVNEFSSWLDVKSGVIKAMLRF